ncbi:MAG: hypothetical protein ACYCS7_12590 [Acidimicrobiales bacterium]
MTNIMGCDGLADVASEMALGILTGPQRAQALSHVEECSACRGLVGELTRAADAVIGQAPESEPPVGFETRVLARIADADKGRVTPARAIPDRWARFATRSGDHPGSHRHLDPGRHRWVVGLAALAAAVATVMTLGGLWGMGEFRPMPAGHLAAPVPFSQGGLKSSPLRSPSSVPLGVVIVSANAPAWVFMSVADPGIKGPIQCHVDFSNGRDAVVGTFRLYDGRGSWGAPLPSGLGTVVQARLVSVDGATVGTARFS